MGTTLHITQGQASRKADQIAQSLKGSAPHKGDDKKQIPVEHQVAVLNAILLALQAMGGARVVNEHNAQVESGAIDSISKQMDQLNATLSSINDYQNIDQNLKGDALSRAIANVDTENSMTDAKRSFVQGEYGNDKLSVQQIQSSLGSDVNALVQQLQMSASLLNQVAQLSNAVSGR